MSFIAMCPAPFQKPKKRVKNGGKSKHAATEAPLPPLIDHLLARNIPQHTSGDPLLSGSLTQVPHHHHHHHIHCAESESQQSAPGSSTSNDSHSTHTSGYQTDDGTFEGKLLKRANRSRPANLRMTAIRDYAPCCNEELAVRRGQRVKVLYKNNDWVYAVTKSGEAGYIPYTFVRPSRKYAGYQSEPEYCQDTDAYRSGYDTDLPSTGQRAGRRNAHRTQICDMVPTYSVHTGFKSHGSPEVKPKSFIAQSPLDQHRRHLPQVSGYTSAMEYQSSPDNRYRPRPAKSLHNILDAGSPPSIREYRPAERKPELDSFKKQLLEELVVIHDFEAQEEDEVFIGKGERVKVLNADDPFWLWVETTPGDQGFVPRTCCSLGNHPSLQNNRSHVTKRVPNSGMSRHARRYYERSRAQHVARQARTQAKQRFHELARLRNNPQNPVLMEKGEIQRVGSKLIVLMDYTATQEDELNIEFAETVFADVLKQAGADRIWAYCPRTDRCGFIPVSLVVPPVV